MKIKKLYYYVFGCLLMVIGFIILLKAKEINGCLVFWLGICFIVFGLCKKKNDNK